MYNKVSRKSKTNNLEKYTHPKSASNKHNHLFICPQNRLRISKSTRVAAITINLAISAVVLSITTLSKCQYDLK